jgi:CubicO group peptidase (beta-lactamase class C family)
MQVNGRVLRALLCISMMCACFAGAVSLPAQTTQKTPSPAVAERIKRIENDIAPLQLEANKPALPLDLEKLMTLYHDPGLSVALIENYKIVWTKGYGVTESGGKTSVTAKTLFQAGSISKPVAAAGALYLVEQGKLSLDQNVNDKLTTWKVPDNEFTQDQKVTLRRLQSHSAGLTVHGFPGYDVDAPLPTLVQVFNGEKPANTDPIRVDFLPGSKFRYSGGGVTIEQQLMIDVTQTSFPEFMKRNVLDKVGMTDSTYEQPIPAARAGDTATGTDASGKSIHGRWHVYPEMAAAGLWTTPTDLAKFAIETALSKQGKSNRVLSQKMTQEMLKPQIATGDPDGGSVGLGFFLGGPKNPDQFGHSGADEGFQALLLMFANSGNGVAIMANSDNGIAVANELVSSIAKEYAWKFQTEPRSAGDTLTLIASARGTDAALDRFTELKNATGTDINEGTLNRLGYTLLQSGKTEDAIRVFERNTKEYPDSWNVYDSLGEAYAKDGKKDLAITNYEKSIKVNPKNLNGIAALKKLKDAN